MLTAVETWFCWFMIYSFIGWIYETILCSFLQKRFVYRGFLMGPYCPIYGCGALIIIFVLGNIQNALVIFLLGVLMTCSLEYFTGWAMEKLFHAKWWDYSNMRFNIHGRVCLLGALAFGSFSVILLKCVHPHIASLTGKINTSVLHAAVVLLFGIFVLDCIFTIRGFIRFEEKLKMLTEELHRQREKVVKSASGVFSKFAVTLTSHERRMIAAFPRLKSIRYNDALTALRNWKKSRKNDK